MFKFIVSIIIYISIQDLTSQNTVGLITYNKEKTYDGYNLIYPHNQPNVYLLNNCGEIVHIWRDSSIWRPGNTAYITKDGKLVKCKRNRTITGNPIWFGGGGAIVEIRDWENKLEWTFEINDTLNRLHHDIAPMPNGNILMIVWNKKLKNELIAAGRDTSIYKENELHADYIIEVNPKTNEIVWRWNMWDHLIQDYDPSKANFGNIAGRPEKIDINFPSVAGGNSWLHTNSIDYNEELDQIMISIPTFNEIWIIDHSTTTSQAAGSVGGLSGKGGDLMYRWGNAATYKKDNIFNQTLYFQHNAHWLDDFISPLNPNYGKIGVFNNRAGLDFSTVNFINPSWDMYEWRYLKTSGAWGPESPYFENKHPEPTKLFSNGLSSVQLLPNDNILILSGVSGYAFELTPDNKIVWEYIVPLKNGNQVSQGSMIVPNDNTTFRMFRYPKEFQAFEGKNLDAKGYIELNPDVNYCNKLVNSKDDGFHKITNLYPNPSTDLIIIESNVASEAKITDINNKHIFNIELKIGKNEFDISSLPAGLYFVTSNNGIIKAFNVIKN
jgi:hypothetical protein